VPSIASIQLNLASAHAALGKREEEEKAMERYRTVEMMVTQGVMMLRIRTAGRPRWQP
jgi:hypothetical protein